jgi:hypothetical protein
MEGSWIEGRLCCLQTAAASNEFLFNRLLTGSRLAQHDSFLKKNIFYLYHNIFLRHARKQSQK